MTNATNRPPPFDAAQRRLVGHGLLVILCAMFAGFALGFSLVGGVETSPGQITSIGLPGSPGGWARMHVGSVTNGLLLIAVAFVLPRLSFHARAETRISWTFVIIAWVNTAFYFFGNLAPNRGLTIGANKFGDASSFGLLAMVPAGLGAIATIVVLVILIRQTFRG